MLSLPALEARAWSLGAALPPRSIVWLVGAVGAGKTTTARALLAGLGVPEEHQAGSPTYTLVHWYDGRRGAIAHIDCYRIARPAEAWDLDWDAIGAADAALIEWPERGGGVVLPPTVTIRLAHLPDPGLRRMEVTP